MAGDSDTYDTVASLVPDSAGWIMSATKLFLKAVGYWTDSHDTERALSVLHEEILQLNGQLVRLQDHVNALTIREVKDANQARLNKLTAAMTSAEKTLYRATHLPAALTDQQIMAHDAVLDAYTFATDLDSWQWNAVRTHGDVDPITGETRYSVYPVDPDFTSFPALPVYVMLVAAEAAALARYAAGNPDRLTEFTDRIQSQLTWLAVRPGWVDDANHPPASLPENVMRRITCFPVAATKYAVNNECVFSIQCDNLMTRTRDSIRDVTTAMPSGTAVLCTVNPDIGIDDEREIEARWGVETAATLSTVLSYVVSTGELPHQPFQGRFASTPLFNNAFVYAIDLAGGLQWWHQLPSATADTLADWDGPRQVGTQWDQFVTVVPAGGNRWYGLSPDGTLHWYQHTGFNTGTPDWAQPVQVGTGWGDFTRIVGGGDGVLYAVPPAGGLVWYRHDGFRDGGPAWRGPLPLSGAWAGYRQIFAGGSGILYTVTQDGRLQWRRHRGFADGTDTWDGPVDIGTAWDQFADLFSSGDGVIYAVRPDGTMWWYRHNAWNTDGILAPPGPAGHGLDISSHLPISPQPGVIGDLGAGRTALLPGTITLGESAIATVRRLQWSGPVAAGTDWHLTRQTFPLLPSSPDPVR